MLWLSLNAQKGITIKNDDDIRFSGPGNLESLTFVHDLVNSPYVDSSLPPTFGVKGPTGVRSAMMLVTNMSQYLPQVSEFMRRISRNKRYLNAALPTSGENAVAMGYRHYLAIRKITPEKEAASWEFVKWMARRDISLPDFWFGYPCRKDLPETEGFERWSRSLSDGTNEIIASMQRSRQVLPPIRGDSVRAFDQLLNLYFTGERSLEETVDALERQAENLFVSRRRTVKSDELFRP